MHYFEFATADATLYEGEATQSVKRVLSATAQILFANANMVNPQNVWKTGSPILRQETAQYLGGLVCAPPQNLPSHR